MSAIGTKRTLMQTVSMSALRGKADTNVRAPKCPLMTQNGHRPRSFNVNSFGAVSCNCANRRE